MYIPLEKGVTLKGRELNFLSLKGVLRHIYTTKGIDRFH